MSGSRRPPTSYATARSSSGVPPLISEFQILAFELSKLPDHPFRAIEPMQPITRGTVNRKRNATQRGRTLLLSRFVAA